MTEEEQLERLERLERQEKLYRRQMWAWLFIAICFGLSAICQIAEIICRRNGW